MSTFIVVGESFRDFGDLRVIFYSTGSLVKAVIYIFAWSYIVYNLIYWFTANVLKLGDLKSSLDSNNTKESEIFKTTVIMLLFWIPYLIVFYPGTGNPDTLNQLTEFFNHGYLVINDYPIGHYLLGANTYTITNQHNFFVTLFYGSCVKFALFLFKDANIGIFFASFIQMIGLASVFSFSIEIMKKYFSKTIWRTMFFIFALFPLFPIFSLFLVKNTLYTIAMLWFTLLIFELTLDRKKMKSIKWNFAIVISVVVQLVTEKYAIYVLMVFFIYMVVQYRANWKRIVCLVFIPIISFKILMTAVLFPLLNVADGDPIEAYSIPIQQTALYVKQYPKDITKKEYDILNKVFVLKNLSKIYNSQLSDPVKSSGGKANGFIEGYRYKTVTKKDFSQYKKVWFEMFFKHPQVYMTAFLNMNYGYLDIGQLQTRTYVDIPANSLPLVLTQSRVYSSQQGNKKIGTNVKFYSIRKFMQDAYNVLSKVPPFSFLLNGNVFLWMTLILVNAVLFYKKYRYVVVFLPLITQIPIIMLSPVNNDQRYLTPFILSSLVILIMFMIIKKKE
jgi:hypothetical protein